MRTCFPTSRLACAGAVISLLSASIIAESPLPDVERLQSSPVLRHLKPNPAGEAKTPGEQTVRQMYVPQGFKVELVAEEPKVHQPIAFAFDERGRIWVAEAYSYPAKQPPGHGQDKLVIFADEDNDGKFESRKVFAENLNLVSGFEVGYGGVWVGAAPQLLFIPDKDRDDKPDGEPEILLEGFGFQDTHECLNSFMWGPDGWLYGNQGVFNYARIGKPGTPEEKKRELRAGIWRYHPIRREFEIFAEGGSNQWGLDYDEHGQIFMTHCRSYWGRGGTTHVIQGGHFWNQANANYAPYIIANPPRDFPDFRNYLLASARYDHGAGGAGAPGTDAIYGGHSHVGTMIYFGDNWPDEYRGRVFTHNLHGHQINQQVNRRWGSGFDTVHAGRDQFFCSDPKYVAVDLQYGPDSAVYFIDWYDQQHCHNPNTERWERGSGRIYRMQWEASFKPAKTDLGKLNDMQLVELHGHKNEWFVRTARRILHERAKERAIEDEAIQAIGNIFANNPDASVRLRGLWTANAIGHFTAEVAQRALHDPDEYVRAWGIRLSTDRPEISSELQQALLRMAKEDSSQVVRLHLASAVQRLPEETAWPLIETLSQHGEDREDRNIPYLLWQSLAQRMPRNLTRALAIAESTVLPQLADWIYWYASTLEGPGLDRVLARVGTLSGEDQRRLLSAVELALQNRPNVPAPLAWRNIAANLYAAKDKRVQQQAERMAAVFGDDSMFPRLREALANKDSSPETRKHAFEVLSRAQDRGSLRLFISLLDDAAFRLPAINLVARFDSIDVARSLLQRFESFSSQERAAALNALTTRASFAQALLDAVEDGSLKRDNLNSYNVRQMTALKNKEITARVIKTWGKLNQTPAEKEEKIAALEKTFSEAPLWAFDSRAGREHYTKLCASCHKLGNEGTRIGPELTGAGRNGIRYYLENIIDPNAVIGTDFQMTTIDTREGDVISGLIINETDSALTLRTTTEERVIAKRDIENRNTSALSLMPEGLLDSLQQREQIELLKFLTSN